jgi:hypothetical protein
MCTRAPTGASKRGIGDSDHGSRIDRDGVGGLHIEEAKLPM